MQDALPIRRTRQFEDLSSETQIQFRLHCDKCGEVYTTGKWSKSSDIQSISEEMNTDIQMNMRHCKRCNQMVCRSFCWNPISSLCEDCSQTRQNPTPPPQKTNSLNDPDAMYSSILGELCLHCQAVLTPGQNICPDCGHQQ